MEIKVVKKILEANDVIASQNRALFEEIAKTKSLGAEAIDGVLARVEEIKEAAAKEKEFLPHPVL